jgi:hypothetical protein
MEAATVEAVAEAPRKTRNNPRKVVDVSHGACSSPFFSIDQFCRRNPAFTEAQIRWQLFNGDKNGLNSSGAILRVDKRLYIDEPKYFDWFRARGSRAVG